MVSSYNVSIPRTTEENKTWSINVRHHEITASTPEEFGGSSGGVNPEELFAASILNCYVATFKVIAKKSHFAYEEIRADCHVELEANNEPPLRSAVITLNVETSMPERAKKVAKKAEEHCYVHQSIKTAVDVRLNTV